MMNRILAILSLCVGLSLVLVLLSTSALAAPDRVVLTGPATILKDGLGAFTLTTRNSDGDADAVTEDTVFNLTTTSAGTGTFYSDAAGTTPITQKTIENGQSTATVYYRDNTFGAPTLTASVNSGQALTDGNKQIGVKGNNTLSFDGTDDYVDCGNSDSVQITGTKLTIEAWIKPTAFSGSLWENSIVDKHGGDNLGYVLRCGGTGILQFNFGNGVGWHAATSPENALTINEWQHVAGVYDGTTQKIYVNGKEVGTIGETANIANNPDINLRLGNGQLYEDRLFKGEIDEVRIWKSARSVAEIRANMHRQLQGNEADLVAYYKMDIGTGTTAYDSGPNGNDGTLTDGPTWQTSGAMSGPANALDFDGTDDYVDLGASNDLKPTSAITVEMWVNANDWGSVSTDKTIMGNTQSGGYNMALYDTDENIGFAVYSGGDYRRAQTSSTDMTGWNHLVGTFDGQYTSLYVNGVLKATHDMGSSGNSISYHATNHTLIGAEVGDAGTATGNYFSGKVDDLRVWNTSRTAAQIRDNMAKSLQGDEPGLVAYYRMDQQAVAGQATLYDQTPNGNDGTLTNMDPASGWVASTAFNTWIGSDSTAWSTAANWSRAAAPGATDNVGIPDYSDNFGYPAGNAPTITGDPTVNHFALATDADVTLSSNLTTSGNLLLGADFGVGAHTVTVAGTTVNSEGLSIGAGTFDANGAFDASGGSTTFTGAGNLKLAGTHNLGTFTKGTGTVTFDGDAAQTISGTFNPYNLTINNAVGVDATGADLTVDEDLTISENAVFTSASDYKDVYIRGTMNLSGDITVSGSWLKPDTGTFNHNDHAVTLDGGSQYIEGSSTFYDLTKTVASAATLMFRAGDTTTITNALTLEGAAGQLLSLRSSTDGTQWNINPGGTRTIGYLDVKDSKNINAEDIDARGTNSVDSGNNIKWKFVNPTLTVTNGSGSGTYAPGKKVAIAANAPDAGEVFDKWIGPGVGNVDDANSMNTTLTMPDDSTSVTATYKDAPATKYTLTVTSGTGSGQYTQGSKVAIEANSPAADKVFKEWTGDTNDLGNPNSPNTTVTMPDGNVSVTATYADKKATTYSLTVTDGTGDGDYTAGTEVGIAADLPANDNKVFDKWIGDDAKYVANVNNPNTTLLMPAQSVEVTANYADKVEDEAFILSVGSGTGSGEYEAGEVVAIAANVIPEGEESVDADRIFDQWIGNTEYVDNVNNPNTTVLMPKGNVSVTATYKDAPVATFTVTVTSGTINGSDDTSGEFRAGRVVRVTADAAPDGEMFDTWTGQTGRLANINQSDTTLVMPDHDVTITATYRKIPRDPYELKVTSSENNVMDTDTKNVVAGETETITTALEHDEQIFHKWTGQTAQVANVNIPATTVTMPAADVEVRASYRAKDGKKYKLGQRIYKEGEGQAAAASLSTAQLLRMSKAQSEEEKEPGDWYGLEAPDEAGYDFVRWEGQTGNVEDVNDKSTRIYMPTNDVTVVAVYAQQGSSASLGDAAYQHCKTDGEQWYASATEAAENRRLVFPYVPGTVSGWWSGYALINTHATQNIPQAGLCLVAINEDGDGFAHVLDKPVFTGNFVVGMVDAMDPDEPRWNDRIAMGVFKKTDVEVADGDLSGFVFMGDQVQGAGYFADNRAAQGGLAFDYVPGAPWWRGLAVLNDHGEETAYVRMAVYQANGRPVTLEDDDRIKIAPGRMMVGILDNLIAGIDPAQRARIELHAETRDGEALEALHGFILVGDWSQATGYLGTGIQEAD
jgi:hypothetical protein